MSSDVLDRLMDEVSDTEPATLDNALVVALDETEGFRISGYGVVHMYASFGALKRSILHWNNQKPELEEACKPALDLIAEIREAGGIARSRMWYVHATFKEVRQAVEEVE